MFEKGNTEASKHNAGGRRTKAEEREEAIEAITQEALIKLANKKVYQVLKKAKTLKDIKDIGLPVTIKGMVDKKKVTGSLTISSLLNTLKKKDEE